MSLNENKAGSAAVDPDDFNAVVAAVVALQAGGGGGSTSAITRQVIGFADLVPDAFGKARGPLLDVAAGDIWVGFGFVIREDFDDSSGPALFSLDVCANNTLGVATPVFTPFKPVQSGNEVWSGVGVSGFTGRGETSGFRYRQNGATAASLIPSSAAQAPSTSSPPHLVGFPMEFTTAAQVALGSVDPWAFDGSGGIIAVYWHFETPQEA